MSETPEPEQELPQPGISLSELTEAFAEAMGIEPAAKADEPVDSAVSELSAAEQSPDELPPVEQSTVDPQSEDPPPAEPAEADDPCEISPRTILEALLFVGSQGNEPLLATRAAELMRDVEPDEIAELVETLNRQYSANGCPYHIIHEGAGFRLALRKTFHPLRNKFYGRVRETRLSQAAVDVLAIIAYQQPLTAEQVNRLRGKPSNHMLSQLVRRGLLRIERRDPKRRTPSYLTTDRFLALFGLDGIEDLPQSEELPQA